MQGWLHVRAERKYIGPTDVKSWSEDVSKGTERCHAEDDGVEQHIRNVYLYVKVYKRIEYSRLSQMYDPYAETPQ